MATGHETDAEVGALGRQRVGIRRLSRRLSSTLAHATWRKRARATLGANTGRNDDLDPARHPGAQPADPPQPAERAERQDYVLDEQVGFLLRQVQQRHAGLFSECFGGEMTPTQWAVLAKLAEIGECSQNLLGRYTAMDVATIKGVVQRLLVRHLVLRRRDPDDGRQLLISLSDEGRNAFDSHLADALRASESTLSALGEKDRAVFLRCLKALR